MAINTKTFHPIEDTSRINQINFNYSNAIGSKISQVVKPILNTIKTISAQHLGSSTYLLINEEDMIAKKVLKVSSWIFGISPTILLGIYLYDRLSDLYHEHFENYSRMEDYSGETSENLQSSTVQLPKEQPKIEPLFAQTLPKILEPSVSFTPDDDTTNASGHTDVDSNLGEGESESVFEEAVTANFTSPKSMPKPEIEDCPEEKQQRDFQTDHLYFRNQGPAESSSSSDNISNIPPNSLEYGFEQLNMTSELVEELKNSPEMHSPRGGVVHRITQIAKGIKAFWASKPFTSNKSKATNAIPSELEHKESFCNGFVISSPITVSHKDTKIDPTNKSISTIKKDIPRMKYIVNGKRCLSIQDFTNQLGLTLNDDETDVLPSNNPIVPRLLHFAHQGLFATGHAIFTNQLIEQDPNKLITQCRHDDIEELRSHTIHVDWDPISLDKPKIIGKTHFNIADSDMRLLPSIYRMQTQWSLDEEEIFLKDLGQLLPKKFDTNFSLPPMERVKEFEADVEAFEILERSAENIMSPNYNWNIALDHLLNKPNVGLNSTVTLEYLNSLKTKDRTFIYEDRLMLPGSVTIDQICNSLNQLKNNHPNNKKIFLPFLVKGWTVDHAVVAVINLADETIEYFDPKGQSSIWPTRTEKQSNMNVFDFLTDLGQKLISPTFSREKIVYNKKNVPQSFSDNINCGAFCLQFIEERMNRKFEEIENDPAVDPKQLRRDLADRLMKNTPSNSI